MAKIELEKIVEEKVKPLVEEAMHKRLGFTITELELDITDKLKKSTLLSHCVDTSVDFKSAKRKFKQEYIARLLQLNFGNVAEVAKVAHVDRRSVHRAVAEMKLNIQDIRENVLQKGAYVKQLAVQDIIEESLQTYKNALNPRMYKAFYSHAPQLSKNIMKELPERPKPLKDALHEFETRYLTRALKENKGNISKTARRIGLRFETLHRKLKELGIDA